MIQKRVGVIGATSLVGDFILPELVRAGFAVTAFSRWPHEQIQEGVEWKTLDIATTASSKLIIENWIFLAPFWVLPQYFPMLEAHGATRLVALSSTSRFTKAHSSNSDERKLTRMLEKSEQALDTWASAREVDWVVLRPTLIYGRGRDRNISEIARFIRRFGFFPLFGNGNGLRQPVHAADVANICFAALTFPHALKRAFDISGGEVLSYRDMVVRIFEALERKPRLLSLPLWVFRAGVICLSRLPRYRALNAAMAERMQLDMAFSHGEAARDLGFSPRPFHLVQEDLPL